MGRTVTPKYFPAMKSATELDALISCKQFIGIKFSILCGQNILQSMKFMQIY